VEEAMKVVAQQLKAQKVTRCSGREQRPSPVKGRWKKARAARQEREAITKFHGARRDCRQSAFLATLHKKIHERAFAQTQNLLIWIFTRPV
jgi:hypothetical protein